MLKRVEPFFPRFTRRRAIDKARAFVDERLNGKDGLGAIFPAMVNSVLMYDVLGVPPDDPRVVIARESIDGLLGGEGRRGLLPALPVADLGHRARLPCAA